MAFALLSRRTPGASPNVGATCTAHVFQRREEKKRKEVKTSEKRDYIFQRHINEKPSIISGCPGTNCHAVDQAMTGCQIKAGAVTSAAFEPNGENRT